MHVCWSWCTKQKQIKVLCSWMLGTETKRKNDSEQYTWWFTTWTLYNMRWCRILRKLFTSCLDESFSPFHRWFVHDFYELFPPDRQRYLWYVRLFLFVRRIFDGDTDMKGRQSFLFTIHWVSGKRKWIRVVMLWVKVTKKFIEANQQKNL